MPAGQQGAESLSGGGFFSDSESDSEAEAILESLGVDTSDIYKLNIESERFKSLPKHLQYDVLEEMREKRKQVPGTVRYYSTIKHNCLHLSVSTRFLETLVFRIRSVRKDFSLYADPLFP